MSKTGQKTVALASARAYRPVILKASMMSDTPERDPNRRSSLLMEMTREELYRRARLRGIDGRSQMSKAQLIVALRTH